MTILHWFLGCAIGCVFSYQSAFSAPIPDLPAQKQILSNTQDSKLILGKHLFFEKRLSRTSEKSCASCHDPSLAFTDHYRRGLGLEAEILPRNTPSLINVRFFRTFNWANPTLTRLEDQFEGPLFIQHPPEMGMIRSDTLLQARLSQNASYSQLFANAYPSNQDSPITWDNALNALAVFVSSLVSFDSPYDRFKRGDLQAMDSAAQRGERLFNSSRLHCAVCHPPPYFTDNNLHASSEGFHNIGLYNLGGTGDYPKIDQGLYLVTQKMADKGKFRTPGLRNLLLTAPYMHDGSVETLAEAVAIFEAGGRKLDTGDFQGDGRHNPNKSPLLKAFRLNKQERGDLLQFLSALTDFSVLTQPEFQKPISLWKANEP